MTMHFAIVVMFVLELQNGEWIIQRLTSKLVEKILWWLWKSLDVLDQKNC